MIKDLIEVIFKDFSRHNVSSSDQQFFNDMSQYGLKIQKSAIEYLIQTYFLTQKFLLAFDQKKFGFDNFSQNSKSISNHSFGSFLKKMKISKSRNTLFPLKFALF